MSASSRWECGSGSRSRWPWSPSPRVLILDEPTNALDPAITNDLRGWVTEHAARGNSVLISSHNLLEVEQLADRIVAMNKGGVAHDATAAELLDGNTVLIRVDRPNLLAQRLLQLGRRAEPLNDQMLRVFFLCFVTLRQAGCGGWLCPRQVHLRRTMSIWPSTPREMPSDLTYAGSCWRTSVRPGASCNGTFLWAAPGVVAISRE